MVKHGMSVGYFRLSSSMTRLDLERATNFTTCLLYIHLCILQLIRIANQGGESRYDGLGYTCPTMDGRQWRK